MLKKRLPFLQSGKKKLIFIFFLFSSIFSFAQQKTAVSGRVVTADKTPLSGVSVNVKGRPGGTTTDADGNFTIQAAKGETLVLSYVGYEEKQVKINNEKSTIEVPMVSTNSSLGEVVVVGYGSQRKRDVTAAVSTVDVSKLKDIPVANVSRLLAGQASGVTVKQANGSPGQEFEVTIRGAGSLGAGSEPLYVVDGFPVGTSIGQNLNPNDIATITILKDAVSTAIYGARGSNGVVLITTKKAKNGEVSLTATANYGVQNIPDSRKTKVLNGVEFAQFKKDIFMDKIRYFENREPTIDEVPLDFRYPEQTKISTNWFDAITNKNAKFQNYNITLSEGKGDIHSLVSVGYIGQEGALIKTKYDNFSGRANIGGKINNFISMGLNINGSYSRQNTSNYEGRDNLVGSTLLMDPREPIYNEDGTYNSYIGGHDGIFGFPNPVQSLTDRLRNREIGDVLSNGFLEFSFLKNFKFKTAVNTRLTFNSYKEFVPSTIAGVNAPPPRDATEYDESFRTINLSADQLLTYANDFGNHHVEVLAGYTSQEETTKGLSGSGNQFPNDLVPFLSSAIIRSSGSTEYGWSMEAYFGRLNYSYKGRYLFSGTFRREGSSRFGSKNKWGDFPAISAGWRISDEKFMPKPTWLNDLKIRGSFGITGNNNIGNYSSLSFMNASNYILGNNFVSGQVVSSFANAQLGWEKSKQTDIGLDLSAFSNKLTFTAELYNRITSNMLLSIQIPAISGFTSTLGNVGKVQNRGLELALGYRTKFNAVNFWSNFNISFNRNKVLEIRGENDEIWNGSFYGDYNVSKVGRPIGMIYGFKVLGIFQNQEEINKSPTQDGAIPGVYKYFDADGDGKISYDTKDMVEIGNPWPKATYGLTLGGDYKNVDLSILFTGAQGYDVFRAIESSTMNMDGVFNVLADSKYRWRSAQNPGSGKYATTNTWKWERESNSRYVYSGSHMWVKNVSVGYTLPKAKIHFGGLRVYVSADNLFLITKYPGNNPDINNNGGINPGLDDEAYPISRTFSIGANLLNFAKMKNKIIIILVLCVLNYSCKKDFLYKTDPTRIDSDNFYKTETEIEQAVNGVYGQLQGIINSQWLFNELPSDNTTIDFNPGDRGQAPSIEAFEFWQVNSGTSNLVGLYNSYYNALYNINNTLAKLGSSTIADSVKLPASGQLKFFRAYYYFELTQYFGDVILITEPILNDPSKAWTYLREPQEKVYAQIESDLKDAVSALPVSYGSADAGRITKGAALTLLGKFYLTKKQYPEAVSTLNQVLTLGYSLLPSYADVFDPAKKNSIESIFEVQYQGGNDLGEWSSFIYTFAPRLSEGAVTGWPQSNPGGWNIPTKDMISAYEEGDLRKSASIGLDFKSPITDLVVPYIKKYNHPHTIYGRTDDDWPVLRFSDVLLMLAEAINEQGGPTAEAYAYLNRVRQRAGLDPVSGLDQQSFRDKVLHERRVELAFENWRWFDLKRTKTPQELAQFLNAYAAAEKADPTTSRQGIPYSNSDYIFEPFEALYPVPSSEILVNNKLSQNQGY